MDEIQDATSNNAGCPQPGSANEDCLSVNVYTPQVILNQINIYIQSFIKMDLFLTTAAVRIYYVSSCYGLDSRRGILTWSRP
jgi:hypothetical protein